MNVSAIEEISVPGYKDPPKEHQFKPGQSGNPGGSYKSRRLTSALIKLLDRFQADNELGEVWLQKLREGDPKFWAMVLDRVEGPIASQIESKAADEDIVTLRDHLRQKPKAKRRKRKDP